MPSRCNDAMMLRLMAFIALLAVYSPAAGASQRHAGGMSALAARVSDTLGWRWTPPWGWHTWKDDIVRRLENQDYGNDSPLIGVLTEPCMEKECDYGKSVVAGPLVEWVHSAGGRVAPIRYSDSDEWLENLFKSVNGIIFPGGAARLWWDSQYFVAASKLWDMAVKANEGGNVFPVFGICLGFELMHILVTNKTRDELLVKTNAEGMMDYLQYTRAAYSSLLFRDLPVTLRSRLGDPSRRLAFMAHERGVPPAAYKEHAQLADWFDILSTTRDRDGTEYVSAVEGARFPFFGLQWHPEKPSHEFSDPSIVHNRDTIAAGFYAASAFVDIARLNSHSVKYKDQLGLSIYNVQPSFTAREDLFHLGPKPDVMYFLDAPMA